MRVPGRRTIVNVAVVATLGVVGGVVATRRGGGPPPPGPGTSRPAVVPAGAYAVDSFHRTVSGGWGNADVGGAWVAAKGAAADLSVDGARAVVALRAAPFRRAEHIIVLPATTVADYQGTFDVTFMENVDALDPAYGGVVAYLVARYQNDGAGGYYRMGLVWDAATRRLWLRTQNPAGKGNAGDFTIERDTGIDPVADVPAGPPYGPYRVAVRITGSRPTTFASKVWRADRREPAGWMLSGRDAADRGPQGTGAVGVRAGDDLQSSPGRYLDVVAYVRIGAIRVGPVVP